MVWEILGAVFEGLGSRWRRHREPFSLRAVVAPTSSAAHRDDFSHCWALVNTDVSDGADDVTFTWRRGPDGARGTPVQLGPIPLMRLAPLDGIVRPSERPAVSAEVAWTSGDGTRHTTFVSLD